jgi:hypothetical protein
VPGTEAHPDIEAADWLALGSLRDSSNAFMSATTMPVGSATFPAHIIDWFHNYGVPKSQIVERGGFVAKTRASALREATTLFGARMNVLLWVHKSALTSASPPGNLAKKL